MISIDVKFFIIIFVKLVNVIMIRSQELQSPCPSVFEYRNDGGVLYGFIQIRPVVSVSAITTKINFTISLSTLLLPSNNVGKLEYLGGSQFPSSGSVVSYRVHFPVTNPVPKVTSIIVNNDILCSGLGDIPGPGQYVSTFGLQHKVYQPSAFTGSNELPLWDPPILVSISTTPQPIETEPPQTQDPLVTYLYSVGVVEPTLQTPRPPPRIEPRIEPPTSSTTTTSAVISAPDTGEECGRITSPTKLIFFGESYERGEWPWLVAIYKKKENTLSFICAGTLVSDQHVITAAHCMQHKSSRTAFKDFVIKIGVFNLEDWAEEDTLTRTLAAAHIHENFNPGTLANDILVLTLKSRITFNDYIRPVCLWKGDPELEKVIGKKGVVTGWGQSEQGPAGRGEPRAIHIPIVSTETCRASKPDFHKLTSSFTFCAGGRDGTGPCLGDSGGGLYYFEKGRWRLRGVVSLSLRPENGDSTCNLNEYIVFTDTAQYMPWIKNYIN